MARPGISLTVEYGSDHQACEMKIEPAQALIHSAVSGESLMSSERVSEILEEAGPPAMRGRLIKRGSFQSSCGVGDITEYENVTIQRATTACKKAGEDHDVATLIIFKRDICPPAPNPFGVVTRP